MRTRWPQGPAALLSIAITAALCAGLACADDWPQWRGPRHDGISREKDWLSAWPQASAPEVAWTASVGKGHSAVSVARGMAYTMGWNGKTDTVSCFDAATGRLVWSKSYPCGTRVSNPGPRATAAVDGDAVYTLSQWGHLHAYHAVTGAPRWAVQLPESCIPEKEYGHVWSPLIVGDLLILSAGRAGLAFDKRTGAHVWGDPAGRGTCASAVPYEANGRRGVIVSAAEGDAIDFIGVNPQTGAELWRYKGWPEKWGDYCVDPVVCGDRFFVTTAETHHKCAAVAFTPGSATKVWENDALAANTGQCVHLDGHIYGVSRRGRLVCLSVRDGRALWEQPGFGAFGSLIAADGKLIVMTFTGDLVVVEATPRGYHELRRVNNLLKNTYTAPVLANGRIYCRDYAGQLVCLAVVLRAGD